MQGIIGVDEGAIMSFLSVFDAVTPVVKRVCSKCRIEKSSLEFNKDKTKKHGLSTFCRACLSIYKKEHRAKNLPKIIEKDKQRYLIEKAARNTGCKIYYLKNKDKIKRLSKDWLMNNKDKAKKTKLKWYKENYNNLKPKYAASASKRRAAKKMRTPVWVNYSIIEALYIKCGKMNHEAGYVKYHVDHIIPMINDKVCGLHTIDNLRIIPAFDNWSKNNKYEVA